MENTAARPLLWSRMGHRVPFTVVEYKNFGHLDQNPRHRATYVQFSGSTIPRDAAGVAGLHSAKMVASSEGRYLLLWGGRNQGAWRVCVCVCVCVFACACAGVVLA